MKVAPDVDKTLSTPDVVSEGKPSSENNNDVKEVNLCAKGG